MLSDLNPNNLNLDFSQYNQYSATFCSQLSLLSYRTVERIDDFYQKAIAEYPGHNIHYDFLVHHQKSNTQALLWCTNSFLVVAFRGTEPNILKDWITDLKFWNYRNSHESNEEYRNLPPGHGGFRSAAIGLITKEKIFDKVDTIIRQSAPNADINSFPIFLTGHSLGAGISQLLIESFNHSGYNFSGAYHFAPPLAVIDDLQDEMRANYGNKVYDIVNYLDYVPRAGRNGVAHFGKFYRICKNGTIFKEEERYIKFRWYERHTQFRLHKIVNHIKAIKDDQNHEDLIAQRENQEQYCFKP